MQAFTLKVSSEDSGRRLDIFVANFCQSQALGLSRVAIQKLILDGHVTVKGLPQVKPHYKLKVADEVSISLEEKCVKALAQAEDIRLDVVYEDSDLAIINKPVGLVVHPAPGNAEHTLVNALMYRFKKLSDINPERPGIVHRLDKDTSGLLVIAKNNAAHLNLAEQFAKHSIKRKYLALVEGEVKFDEDVIEAPIVRHPLKRKDMAVGYGENSRYAKTHYRTLKRTKEFSVLELTPFTGRTHQLRVHLAFLGHPILGDVKYNRRKGFPRLALHAFYLGFIHPSSKKFVEFSCPIPREFKL